MQKPSGDIDACYRRYFVAIRAKCRRLLASNGEAEELAQETFVRFWRAELGAIDDRAALSWLYRTATRLALDRLRARKVRLRFVANSEPVLGTVSDTEITFVRDALSQLVGRAEDEELEVAVLCRADGMSQSEAAGVLGISERTVRRRLEAFDVAADALRKEWL